MAQSWQWAGRLVPRVLTLILALPLVMLACSAIGILWHSDRLKGHELWHEPPSYPPIDLVIPWSGEQTSTNIRQRDNGELRCGLRSYAKHAPWLRHIHILQNGDQPPPSFMEPNDWISRVDRCQLFTNASHCPTYNGHAANTVIPRIPGLTEHFIVADDDIFLTAPSKPSHWFTADGRPIVRTTYKQQPIYSKEHVGIDRKLISKHPEWPTMKWSKYTHQIRPLRRSWIREFEAKHPGFHEWVQSHQSGYYGGGVSEEMDQIWWEHMKDRVEVRGWASPEAWCSFYHFWHADSRAFGCSPEAGWDFQLLVYKVLNWFCGFRSINIQDEWGDGGAPEGVRMFLEELYPEKPWFEKTRK